MVACPASWKAIERFSSSVIIFVLRSKPPTIRSTASIKSCLPTFLWLLRAAINAASLQTLAISAPENPGVCLARKSISTVVSILIGRKCTPNISLRSCKSGNSTWICLSKRPARKSAESSTSARLVAARIITPEFVPKPSISVSSWFNVDSRSSLPPVITFLPRARPTASISSIKMIAGAFSLAWRKRSRTRLAPTPTNISTKSEPDMEKNGTSASPATALASKVLPVPGGPTSNAPLGILPPSSVYFFGFLRKATISSTSCLAPAKPATSLKVTLSFLPLSNTCARALPTPNIPPAAPETPRLIHIKKRMISANGNTFTKIRYQ